MTRTRVAGRHILALILAGGKGSRLGPLSEGRAKPVVPFGGTYRLIDFALSNAVHSGLSDVWVLEQHELHSLNDHLANGRPWDLDRTRGGLLVLPPFPDADEDGGEGGVASGNADALALHRALIEDFAPDVLLVLSADHVYLLDYAPVIEGHVRSGADVTLVTTRLPEGESASRFGNVRADGEGRVTDFAYKPDEPLSDLVTTEVFVYDVPALLGRLDGMTAGGRRLGDFGHELLPALVRAGRAREHRFDGYWRDVGTPEAYHAAHLDLLDGRLPPLDGPEWPLLTTPDPRLPARIEATARLDGSLVSPGAHVAGDVRRSVLGPGVRVEAGATVRDAVLLPGATVRAGAVVERAVVDEAAEIGTNARVGGPDDLTVIGARARVADGERIAPGARVPPGERRPRVGGR